MWSKMTETKGFLRSRAENAVGRWVFSLAPCGDRGPVALSSFREASGHACAVTDGLLVEAVQGAAAGGTVG